jgi:predicted alpha/beta hydrolase family esterase
VIEMAQPTVLIVPGLRDHVADHWQTLLAARLPGLGYGVRTVAPLGRTDLRCCERVESLEREATLIDGPIILVAHSGGVITVAHWARRTHRVVLGALLAVPPDFEQPMPEGYPTLEQLDAQHWLPVPRQPLPFRSIVAASRNDPLASFDRVEELARGWRAELVDLGAVGHLNPASGYGPWPRAEELIRQLAAERSARAA